jgi:hypothetical protein
MTNILSLELHREVDSIQTKESTKGLVVMDSFQKDRNLRILWNHRRRYNASPADDDSLVVVPCLRQSTVPGSKNLPLVIHEWRSWAVEAEKGRDADVLPKWFVRQ